MIVRNLLAKFGFLVDDRPLVEVDRKIDKAKAAVTGLVGALGALGLGAKALEAVRTSLDFSKELGRLQTLVPENIASVAHFKEELQALAVQSGKSTSDLAGGLYEVGSAVGFGSDSMDILKIATQGAVAANSDLKTSYDLLSAVTLAYGDTSVEATRHVNDLAFMAVNMGKTTLPELASRIGMVTGPAKLLGVTQKELFAIMGTASGVTGPTAHAFTQLAAVMGLLANPGKDLQKRYKELHIAKIEDEVANKGLIPTLQRLAKHTDGTALSVTELSKMFNGNEEAGRLVGPILGALTDRYHDMMVGMDQAGGMAEKSAKAMTKGLGSAAFKAEQTEQKFHVLKQQIGDQLAPVVQNLKDDFLDEAKALSDTLLPLLGDLAGKYDEVADRSDRAGESTSGLRVVIAGLMAPIDVVSALVQKLILSFASMEAAAALAVQGRFKEAHRVVDLAEAENDKINGRLKTQIMDIGRAIDNPEQLAQLQRFRVHERSREQIDQDRETRSATRQAAANELRAGVVQTNSIGKIEVHLPPGSTEEHARQLAKQAGPLLFDVMFKRAAEAIPHPAKADAP